MLERYDRIKELEAENKELKDKLNGNCEKCFKDAKQALKDFVTEVKQLQTKYSEAVEFVEAISSYDGSGIKELKNEAYDLLKRHKGE